MPDAMKYNATFQNAMEYVGSASPEHFLTLGHSQLELLKLNGLRPNAHVLEIGCGCLRAGRLVMAYLDEDLYVGVEPNLWLIDAAKQDVPGIADLILEKRPIFLRNAEFDASEAGRSFDFVLSHSVLSHAAHWQCPLFLRNVKRILAPDGIALASIRFYNDSNQIAGDSRDEEWVYPGNSFFSWKTVRDLALENRLMPEWRPDYRTFVSSRVPAAVHDWIRLTHLR